MEFLASARDTEEIAETFRWLFKLVILSTEV